VYIRGSKPLDFAHHSLHTIFTFDSFHPRINIIHRLITNITRITQYYNCFSYTHNEDFCYCRTRPCLCRHGSPSVVSLRIFTLSNCHAPFGISKSNNATSIGQKSNTRIKCQTAGKSSPLPIRNAESSHNLPTMLSMATGVQILRALRACHLVLLLLHISSRVNMPGTAQHSQSSSTATVPVKILSPTLHLSM
jgi:hypothetical protein